MMSDTRSNHPTCLVWLFRQAVVVLLLLALSIPGYTQSLSDALSPTPTPEAPPVTEAPPTLESRMAEAEVHIANLDQMIAQAQAGMTEEQSIQMAVPLSELEARVHTLNEARETYARQISTHQEHQDIQRSIMELRDQVANFQGLPEPPPYRVQFVDSLRTAVRSRKLNLESAQHDLEYSTRTYENVRQELDKAKRELRSLQDAASSNTATAVDPALQWRLTLGRDRVTQMEARTRLREATDALQRDVVALRELQLELDQKRVAVASAGLDTDPESLTRQIEEHKALIETVREKREKALDSARKAQEDADKGLASVRARIASATPEEMPALAALLETRRVQAETARRIVDTQFNLLASVENEKQIIENRYRILMPLPYEELRQIHTELQRNIALLARVSESLEGRIATLRSQITSLQSEIDAWKPEQGSRLVAEERLASLRSREAVFAEGLFRVVEMQQLHALALEDATSRIEKMPLSSYLKDAWTVATRIWDFELTTYGEEPAIKRITLGKVFLSLFLVFGGFLLASLLARLIRRITHSRFHLEENVSFILQKVTFYVVLGIAFIYTLEYVDIPLTVFGFMGGALAIGVGFGAQNLINNFISGIIIFMEKPIKLGDVVEVDGQSGTLVDIGSRASRLRLYSGIDIIVPNSSFLEKNVVNWTLTDQKIRFSVQVGVAYGSPTRDVAKLIRRAVDEHQRILKDPKPVVLFQNFGESALIFEVFFWLSLSSSNDSRVVRSDIRFMIDNLFRDAGISIAYPQRDLHIDTLRPIEVRLAPPSVSDGPYLDQDKPKLPS